MPPRELTPSGVPVKSRPLAAVVLAAGEGKRFKSTTPKVLHSMCGKPLLGHVLTSIESLDLAKTVLVVGRGSDEVKAQTKELTKRKPTFALQAEQLGTADAAQV